MARRRRLMEIIMFNNERQMLSKKERNSAPVRNQNGFDKVLRSHLLVIRLTLESSLMLKTGVSQCSLTAGKYKLIWWNARCC